MSLRSPSSQLLNPARDGGSTTALVWLLSSDKARGADVTPTPAAQSTWKFAFSSGAQFAESASETGAEGGSPRERPYAN